MKSNETKVFEWLKEIQAANPADAALAEADIQDSSAQEMTKNLGIFISNSEWNFAPSSELADAREKEFDVFLILAFYGRVRGTDKSERQESRDKVFQLAQSVAGYFFADQSLGGRFCDVQLFRAYSGNAPVKSDSYSVINLPIVLNPTGALSDFSINRPIQ